MSEKEKRKEKKRRMKKKGIMSALSETWKVWMHEEKSIPESMLSHGYLMNKTCVLIKSATMIM